MAKRLNRSLCKLAHQRQGFGQCLAVINDFGDQAPIQGLIGTNGFIKGNDLQGPRQAYDSWQGERTAAIDT